MGRVLKRDQCGQQVPALLVAFIPGLVIDIFQNLGPTVGGCDQLKELLCPETVHRFLQRPLLKKLLS